MHLLRSLSLGLPNTPAQCLFFPKVQGLNFPSHCGDCFCMGTHVLFWSIRRLTHLNANCGPQEVLHLLQDFLLQKVPCYCLLQVQHKRQSKSNIIKNCHHLKKYDRFFNTVTPFFTIFLNRITIQLVLGQFSKESK